MSADNVVKPGCAACGKPTPWGIQFTIHRDGFGVGPEVRLCWACGEGELPTCEELWARIAERRAAT